MLDLVIEGTRKDLGGGLEVGRVLPFARRRMVGPFIFLDHMGPADFRTGEGIDVRPPISACPRSPICSTVRSITATVSASAKRSALARLTG
jgi:hypothetical protein